MYDHPTNNSILNVFHQLFYHTHVSRISTKMSQLKLCPTRHLLSSSTFGNTKLTSQFAYGNISTQPTPKKTPDCRRKRRRLSTLTLDSFSLSLSLFSHKNLYIFISMRTLCPNYDNENGLDTVLEVPVPEEMFHKMGSNANSRWQNMRALMKAQSADKSTHLHAKSNSEFMALLKLVGSPLIPFQVKTDRALIAPLRECSIEASTAKYIVQQYVAATGGITALNSSNSMYAVGQVKMAGSDMHQGEGSIHTRGNAEVGGFVLWQKNPDLWFLELVVSGYKIIAGSDGKVAWSQSSSQPGHANRGPPRPLRRFFQGLDPRCTANLFLEAVCIGEKSVNGDDCFMLKVETPLNILKVQSSSNTEIVHHKIWGYFSQRTGLLVKFEDTKLVRMKNPRGNDSVFWETSIESVIGDYRYIEGINIAHSGKTVATLYRYGESHNHKRKIEETWRIEEVDFNICGLSMDCFLPPSDLKREQDATEQ